MNLSRFSRIEIKNPVVLERLSRRRWKHERQFEGRPVIDEGVSLEKWKQNCARNKYPAGSSWSWMGQCVYGPKA